MGAAQGAIFAWLGAREVVACAVGWRGVRVGAVRVDCRAELLDVVRIRRVGVHVEEQINNLRAQLLRSEQEKELMRVKLQEEQQQREKAQKQVCGPGFT